MEKERQAKPLFPGSCHSVSFFVLSNMGFKFFTVKPFLVRNDLKKADRPLALHGCAVQPL